MSIQIKTDFSYCDAIITGATEKHENVLCKERKTCSRFQITDEKNITDILKENQDLKIWTIVAGDCALSNYLDKTPIDN